MEQELIKEYNCKVDYNKKKINIILDGLKSVKINKNIEIDENVDDNYLNILKSRQKIKNIEEDKETSFKFNKINVNYKNDENIPNENIEEIDDSLNNVEMEEENPFIANISEKIEEKKVDTLSEFNFGEGFGIVKKK